MSRLSSPSFRAIFVATVAVLLLIPSSTLAFATTRSVINSPRSLNVPAVNSVPGWSSEIAVVSNRMRNDASRRSSSPTALAYTVSPEPIHTAFDVATFGPQIFWLFMILLPNANYTKKVMGGFGGSGATAPLAEFNDVFDPNGDPQNAFIGMVTNYPNFVAEEWSHVLTWDLLVGRFIWLDGIKRGIFTSHSVLLTNLIGPPGLLLHWLTCIVTGKEPWEKDSALEIDES